MVFFVFVFCLLLPTRPSWFLGATVRCKEGAPRALRVDHVGVHFVGLMPIVVGAACFIRGANCCARKKDVRFESTVFLDASSLDRAMTVSLRCVVVV